MSRLNSFLKSTFRFIILPLINNSRAKLLIVTDKRCPTWKKSVDFTSSTLSWICFYGLLCHYACRVDTLLYLEVAIRWQSLQGKDLSVRRCPQARLRAEEQLEAVVGIGVDVSACYLVHVLKIYFPLQKYNKFFIFTLPQYYLHLHLSCLTRYRLGNYNGGGYFWPPPTSTYIFSTPPGPL